VWSLHAAKGEWGYEVVKGHMYDDRDIGDNETGDNETGISTS